jgi:hypothetical protein
MDLQLVVEAPGVALQWSVKLAVTGGYWRVNLPKAHPLSACLGARISRMLVSLDGQLTLTLDSAATAAVTTAAAAAAAAATFPSPPPAAAAAAATAAAEVTMCCPRRRSSSFGETVRVADV